MPDFQIRSASADDAPALSRLLAELGYPAQPADLPDRLSRVVAEGGTALLADGDAGALGVACVTSHATLHAARPVAYITALVVAPEARGRGVGRALVAAAEAWARARGCERMSVTSAERRSDAHAFYPSCGMPYTGRRFSKTLA